MEIKHDHYTKVYPQGFTIHYTHTHELEAYEDEEGLFTFEHHHDLISVVVEGSDQGDDLPY